MTTEAGSAGLRDVTRFRQRIPRPTLRYPLTWPHRAIVERARRAAASDWSVRPLNPTSHPDASVLLALRDDPRAGVEVLVTRRSSSLRHHAGEIAFPGGARQPGEDAVTAAVREAHEERGLDPEAGRVLGSLGITSVRARGISVEALVGTVSREVSVQPDQSEVEAVAWVPLVELVHPERTWSELWFDVRGGWATMWFFDLGEDVLWGASARMLARLLVS